MNRSDFIPASDKTHVLPDYGRSRMTFDAIAFVQDLLRRGRLPSHAETEHSKPINFHLDYQSKHGPFLELLFEKITVEVEQQESRNRRSVDVRQRFAFSIRTLILNVMQVRALMDEGSLFLSIPLNRNNFGLNKRYAPKTVAYKPFKHAFEGLVEMNYLAIHRRGFNDPDGLNDPVQTQILATEKLISAFEGFISGREFSFIRRSATEDDFEETIILRGSDKQKQEYEDNDFTIRARNNLDRINAVLSEHTYGLAIAEDEKAQLQKALINNIEEPEAQPFIDFSSVRLYRIFSDGVFDRGGRFYRGWWQNVPKKYRPFITIDDTKTVELDYSMFHPSILYAEHGISLDFDAYKIHPKVSRSIGKGAFNALLNAKGRPKKPSGFDQDATGISWLDFLDLMMEKHKVLTDAGYFLNGYGLHVQFFDAELTEKILLHFTSQNVPCLPIHDSFIVSQDKATELRTVMKELYKETFGHSIEVKQEY